MSQTSIVQFFKSRRDDHVVVQSIKGQGYNSPTSVIDDSMFDNSVKSPMTSADEL